MQIVKNTTILFDPSPNRTTQVAYFAKYALSKVHILIKYALSKVHLTNLSTALRRMIQRKRELEKRMQEEFVKARKEAINHHSLARMKTLSGKE